jgi:hypothetical protein
VAAAFFFAGALVVPAGSFLTDFFTEPVFSSTNFVPAAAAPATAPPTTVETASTTASLVFAMMPFEDDVALRTAVFFGAAADFLAGALLVVAAVSDFLAGAFDFGVGDFIAVFFVVAISIYL